MLTLKRFKALAESYGGDLARWPDERRDEAHQLLAQSTQAQTILAEARRLDAAIAPGHATGVDDAALARLRAGVQARIASTAPHRIPYGRGLGFLGLAASGGFAIMAGLLIGTMWASAQQPDSGVLAMLQPAPIHALADEAVRNDD